MAKLMKTFLLVLVSVVQPLCGQDSNELEIGIPSLSTFPTKVKINQRFGTLDYNASLERITYTGDFNLRTNTGVELKARNALYDLKRGIVELEGDVSIFNGTTFQRGDKAGYNLNSRAITTSGLKFSVDPVLLDSGSFRIEKDNDGNDVYVGTDAAITTHDVQNPSFWVKAKEIKVFPDDRVTFRNLKLYAGETPIFWLPYFSQPLDQDLGYHFSPGFQSHWGGYILNRYGVLIEGDDDSILSDQGKPWLLAQYHLDLRARRGVGVGADFRDIRLSDNPNLTGLRLYYLNDLAPSLSRSGIPRGFVNEDRYRVEFKHRHTLRESETNLQLIQLPTTLLAC